MAARIQTIREERAGHLIYLVENDPHQAEELTTQIGYFGYTVKTYPKFKDVKKIVRQHPPTALLVGLSFSNDCQPDADFLDGMALAREMTVPTIALSSDLDVKTRLLAVQAGSNGYFTRPVDIGALVEALDRLIDHDHATPYRILIIDDAGIQAKIYARYLVKSGMETRILTDPFQVIDVLSDFNPDLILLDMYMPACTGMELARVIRQIETYLSIPIVFLSVETNRDLQIEAINQGGDDFLAKPISAYELVSSVTTRVQRYRQLRVLMMRDSLTGLLNHTTVKERLNQEVSRACRQNSQVAFAMLDLDQFKSINDNYGHSAGDRLLKSLSQLLKQRLRTTDVIGRYGGDEFAIIFPEISGMTAVDVMDELRSSFEGIRHRVKNADFAITFSCGVASYPVYKTAIELSDMADNALYTAKNQGRNRVISGDA